MTPSFLNTQIIKQNAHCAGIIELENEMKKLIVILAIALSSTTANATSDLDYLTDEQYAAKKLDIARELYIDAAAVIVAHSDKPEAEKKAIMLEVVQQYEYQIVCRAAGNSKEACDGKGE